MLIFPLYCRVKQVCWLLCYFNSWSDFPACLVEVGSRDPIKRHLFVHETCDDASDVLMSKLLEELILSLTPVELILIGINSDLQLRLIAEDKHEHLLRLLEWPVISQIHSTRDDDMHY